MLGMIIGVGAVVLMLAIGQGAQAMVSESIASMGSNLFIVLSGSSTSGGVRMGGGTVPTLTANDAGAIGELPEVAAVSPVFPNNAQVVYGSSNWTTMIAGSTPAQFEVRDWRTVAGTIFGETDVRSATRVIVLGQTVARNLFGDENPVGKTVRVKNSPFLVLGVLAAKGQSLDGRDQDDTAIVPLTTAQRQLFGNQFPGMVRFIMVKARSAGVMPRAETAMIDLLRQRHRIRPGQDDDFTVRNLTALAQTAAGTTKAMSAMLGAIASVSLLVGGIGIMNIMLVSVTERTREIGIRMAIGARHRDILLQFLTEALIISLAGSLIGAALGFAGAWLASRLADMTVVVTLWSILLAFGVAAAVGIFFGFYPARKAANLRPIEALRYQ
jgi:putative ABC transport system permease protein